MALATAAAGEFGGAVIGQRGDEVVAVFESARQAIRAACALQVRVDDQRHASGPVLLGIGVGLDAGEAESADGGYISGALNVASRLCGLASSGEVIASEAVTGLARKVDDIRYSTPRTVRLKGLDDAVRVVRVSPQPRAPAKPAPSEVQPSSRSGTRGLRPAILLVAALAVTVGAFWFARSHGGASGIRVVTYPVSGQLVQVDDAGGDPVATSRLTVPITAAAAWGSTAWVASGPEGSVMRIDLRTGKPSGSITIGGFPAGVAVDPSGHAWVTDSGRGVVEVSSAGKIMNRYLVGNGTTGIAIHDGVVWVTNSVDNTVSLISIDRAAVIGKPIATRGADPVSIAIGLGSAWVANAGTNDVSQIDLNGRHVLQPVAVAGQPDAVAVGDGRVWVAVGGTWDTVSEIAHGVVVGTIQSVGGRPGSSLAGISVDGGVVWVADAGGDQAVQIDGGSGRVVERIRFGDHPGGLTTLGHRVLISIGSRPQPQGRGTLTIMSTGAPATVDPSQAVDGPSRQLLTMTNDGLLAFRKGGGWEGGTLVPDLATAIPQASQDASSYTFTLRAGLHYSNGAVVTPADIRFAIERDFMLSPRAYLYGGLQGALKCLVDRAIRCQLPTGIVVDQRRRRITFNLSQPDPAFLTKLALPYADAVPSTFGMRAASSSRPLPATGPYRITPPPLRHMIVLSRNEEFRQWSADAQPVGLPNVIKWRTRQSVKTALHALVTHAADVVHIDPSPTHAGALGRLSQYGVVRTNPSTSFWYLFMNSLTSPFAVLPARKAVNYAIDRAAIADLFGGELAARPVCQLLPYGFAGYQYSDPCAYATVDRRTRRLQPEPSVAAGYARRGSLRGMPLSVDGFSGSSPVLEEIVKNLNDSGIPYAKAQLQTRRGYYALVGATPPVVPAGIAEWTADTPDPGLMLLRLLSCSVHAPAVNPNLSGYCDAGYRIHTTATTAPAADWGAVDDILANALPWAPLVDFNWLDVVSPGLHDYTYNRALGPLLDQMWVQH